MLDTDLETQLVWCFGFGFGYIDQKSQDPNPDPKPNIFGFLKYSKFVYIVFD